jgi:hypothetical protein
MSLIMIKLRFGQGNIPGAKLKKKTSKLVVYVEYVM